ncbi:MAG: hypothetical protein ACK528_11320 [Alphaproteobacteria bacterium]|jgi:hypothetical protein
MILMRDALAIMEQRGPDGNLLPFSCQYVTYSRQRNEGGKIITVDSAVLSFDKKPFTGKKSETPPTERINTPSQPNHFANKTRNLKIVDSGAIRKMRIRMLITFNGQQVVY